MPLPLAPHLSAAVAGVEATARTCVRSRHPPPPPPSCLTPPHRLLCRPLAATGERRFFFLRYFAVSRQLCVPCLPSALIAAVFVGVGTPPASATPNAPPCAHTCSLLRRAFTCYSRFSLSFDTLRRHAGGGSQACVLVGAVCVCGVDGGAGLGVGQPASTPPTPPRPTRGCRSCACRRTRTRLLRMASYTSLPPPSAPFAVLRGHCLGAGAAVPCVAPVHSPETHRVVAHFRARGGFGRADPPLKGGDIVRFCSCGSIASFVFLCFVRIPRPPITCSFAVAVFNFSVCLCGAGTCTPD